jgi:osmotically-inducible protein OsmY
MTKARDIRETVEDELSREDVEDELNFDPLVDASDIAVESVGGKVALTGTVPSYPQYLQAVAAAQRVAGVRQVHNHIAVELPGTDARDDMQLTAAASHALRWDVSVPAGVRAVARDGAITLTGRARCGAQRRAAEAAVRGLTGVRGVTDEIEIGHDRAGPAEIADLVRAALARSALIPDDSDVRVDASGRSLSLTGHVRTWAAHDAVIDAAWRARGVHDVADRLIITG